MKPRTSSKTLVHKSLYTSGTRSSVLRNSLLLQSTTRKHSCHGAQTQESDRQKERKRGSRERQRYIKCFSFNETNPRDVQSAHAVQFPSMGQQTDRQKDRVPTQEANPRPGWTCRQGVSPGWHWGWSHWAGHRSSGHWLLLHLRQVGLEVCVHIFMHITFSLEV